jgi:hypothetical protein
VADVQGGGEDLALGAHEHRSEVGRLLDEDRVAGALDGGPHLVDDGLEAVLQDLQQRAVAERA